MRSLTVRRVLFLVFLGLSAVFAGVLSLCFGVRPTQLSEVQSAFFAFDPGIAEHIVVQNLRLPRAFAALIGGGALGLAGALMQVLTRNPLADPSIIGVSGGAARNPRLSCPPSPGRRWRLGWYFFWVVRVGALIPPD